MYSANPTTDTKTVASETSKVGVIWPTSRTAYQESRRGDVLEVSQKMGAGTKQLSCPVYRVRRPDQISSIIGWQSELT
jgi:hypothetical protein